MGSYVSDWDDDLMPRKSDFKGLGKQTSVSQYQNRMNRVPAPKMTVDQIAQLKRRAEEAMKAEWREVPQEEVPVSQSLVLSSDKGLSMSDVEADLRRALVKFASAQALIGRFGGQQPPTGSVLRWTVDNAALGTGEMVLKRGNGFDEDVRFQVKAPRSTTFIAVRDNKIWHVTGTRNNSEVSWEDLVKLIDNSPCQLVSEWVEVPAPEKPSEEMMDPTTYARMMFGGDKNETQKSESETIDNKSS